MKKSITVIAMAFIAFASCKKSTTSTTTAKTSPPPTATTTTTTYSMSFLDGSTNTTYTWTNNTIQLAITSYTANANINFGQWIDIPGNSNNSGYIYLVTPLDSSNMHKFVLNTNYLIHYYPVSFGQSIPDSDIGSLSFVMSTPSGTDSTVSQNQTTTYYNKITSVTYIGRVYDTYNQIISPQYVIKGTFNALVKNNVTNLSRVLSNGQYSFVVGTRAH